MLSIKNFKFIQADSEDLKNAIYQLRYKVYVEEFAFEKKEDHPNGYEKDEYDENSIHFAALDGNDEVVGAVRLVLNSEKGFPIEHAVKTKFIGDKPSLDKITEISRLAVSSNFRRRKEDGQFGVESYIKKSEGGILPDKGPASDQQEKRKRPVIVLGLYKILYHASKRMGITHWYMITEEKLFYTLIKYGFIFYQIGEPVQHHGTRVPYLGIILDIEQRLIKEKPEFLNMLLMGLDRKYHPKLMAS
ncbi:MAG: PEP-CTERM/exosortase system-associated acyltransferase [Deltaproteobacteria bacterium]|nr:PEP-CTERM/exosortase system-associated acyltransferase [Deltaproteobacteria bacterium]